MTKTSYGTIPPKVVYSLTPIGKQLSEDLTRLNFLGEKLARVNQEPIVFDINANQVKKLHDDEKKK